MRVQKPWELSTHKKFIPIHGLFFTNLTGCSRKTNWEQRKRLEKASFLMQAWGRGAAICKKRTKSHPDSSLSALCNRSLKALGKR